MIRHIVALPMLLAVAGLTGAGSPASGPSGSPVPFDTHDGYFVSNQFEPNQEASFVVLRTQAEFDKVFGSAVVMGDKSHRLPAGAFDKKMVLGVVKRGKAIWQFKVEAVTAEANALTVRYTGASKPSDSAEFACPLIVSIDKGDYSIVQFVENGKPAGKIGSASPSTRPVDEKAAKDLISLLGHKDVKVREKATQDLIGMGPAVRPLLRAKAKEENLDPEVATRIETALEKIDAAVPGGRTVTDAATGITVSVDDGAHNSLTATRNGKVLWKVVLLRPQIDTIKIVAGNVIVSPNGATIDLATGVALSIP